MFGLIAFGVAGLLIIGAATLWVMLQATDPISSYIRQRCPTGSCSTSLIPDVFSVRQNGLAAGHQLLDAGYFENGGSGGDVEFMKPGQPPYGLMCHTNYHVTLSPDEDGNLGDARGATSTTCL